MRDGGYLNNWHFDKKFAREYLLACVKTGVDVIEIGWRGTEEFFSHEKYGPWRFPKDNLINEVSEGIRLPDIAVMCNFGKIKADDFVDKNESPVDIIRLACSVGVIKEGVSLLCSLKKKGYKVSLNATGFSNYSDMQLQELEVIIKSSELDYFYIADSYGSMFPSDIPRLLERFIGIDKINIGFHPHNSFQMAFANTLEAIRIGASIVDSSLLGMGRGAGNLPSEIMLTYLQGGREDKYNVIPILNFIDLYMKPLHKEIQWGYSIPYLLSGYFKCHPYFIRDIDNYQTYTVEETWAILSEVKGEDPSTYIPGMIDRIVRTKNIGKITKDIAEQHVKQAKGSQSYEKVISTVGFENKTSFVGRYKEQKFLILANGPMLFAYKEKIDRFIKKNDPIIIGANYLGGLIIPHYHGFINTRRLVKYVDQVHKDSKLLLGAYISDKVIEERVSRDYETVYYQDILGPKFEINNGVISSSCRTVSILMIGVAVAMGAKRIYVAGLDGYVNTEDNRLHSDMFYEEPNKIESPEVLMEMHKWCEYYIESISKYMIANNGEGVHVITPTAYKSYYLDVDNLI
ncbi:MAG: hypothetical protein HOD90_12395 [Nitrospina sp.]|nr:hypothetical protein [Nitrospina sp.]